MDPASNTGEPRTEEEKCLAETKTIPEGVSSSSPRKSTRIKSPGEPSLPSPSHLTAQAQERFSKSKQLLEELTDLFFECKPDCFECEEFIQKLNEHIHAVHGHTSTTEGDGGNLPKPKPKRKRKPRKNAKTSNKSDLSTTTKKQKRIPDTINDSNLICIGVVKSEYYSDSEEDLFDPVPWAQTIVDVKCDVDEEFDVTPDLDIDLQQEGNDDEDDLNKPVRGRKRKRGPHMGHECSVCHKVFRKADKLYAHFKSEHKDVGPKIKPYGCSTCGKTFDRFIYLSAHIKVAHDESGKNYTCEVCGQTFALKRGLVFHMRSHTGEKPYVCQYCQKGFGRKHLLTYHERIHTGDKPFKCDHCEASFVRKDKLTSHLRTHSGEKPYACETCEKRFSMQELLVIHRRTHTGERPFMCELCSKSFMSNRTLYYHIKSHRGSKEFECTQCAKSFTLKSQLTNHAKIHSGQKDLVCDKCGRCFTFRRELKSHKCEAEVKRPETAVQLQSQLTQDTNHVNLINAGFNGFPYIIEPNNPFQPYSF